MGADRSEQVARTSPLSCGTSKTLSSDSYWGHLQYSRNALVATFGVVAVAWFAAMAVMVLLHTCVCIYIYIGSHDVACEAATRAQNLFHGAEVELLDSLGYSSGLSFTACSEESTEPRSQLPNAHSPQRLSEESESMS